MPNLEFGRESSRSGGSCYRVRGRNADELTRSETTSDRVAILPSAARRTAT